MDNKEFNVYLRPITEDDTNNIIQWRNSEHVRKYFIYQEEFTREGHLEWIETKIKTGNVIQFMIVLRKTNKTIGSVYLRDVNRIQRKAEYGIFIGEDEKGKGYGTQAARLMIKYAFEDMHLHKLYLRVFADNVRAISSYKKAGFYQEGLFIDDVYVQDAYRDIVWMAIINSKE